MFWNCSFAEKRRSRKLSIQLEFKPFDMEIGVGNPEVVSFIEKMGVVYATAGTSASVK